MRRPGENLAPPAVSIERTVDETIAELRGRFCLFVADRAKVIAGHMKALAIKLAHPAFNGDLPIRMPIEKAADNAEADWLACGRRRRELCRGELASDQPADHGAIDLLQGPIVFALISKQERMPCAEGL